MSRISWFDVEELAANILNVEEDKVEEALYEKYEISSDVYHQIIQELFDRLDFSISPLTHDAFVGFGDKGLWLIKKAVNQQFISGLIEWATEGTKLTEDMKGFSRTITKSGKPEYEIIIKKVKGGSNEE